MKIEFKQECIGYCQEKYNLKICSHYSKGWCTFFKINCDDTVKNTEEKL